MRNGSSGQILVYQSRFRLRNGFGGEELHEAQLLAPDAVAVISDVLRRVAQLPMLSLSLSFWLFYILSAVQLTLIAASFFYSDALQFSLLSFFLLALLLHLRRKRLKRCVLEANQIAREAEMRLTNRFHLEFCFPHRDWGRPFTHFKVQVFAEKRPYVEPLSRALAASPAVEICRKTTNESPARLLKPESWAKEELVIVTVEPSSIFSSAKQAFPPMLAPDFSDIVPKNTLDLPASGKQVKRARKLPLASSLKEAKGLAESATLHNQEKENLAN